MWHYFAGIDPAQGGAGRTKKGGKGVSDDFAISTWRVQDTGWPAELVKIRRENGITSKQMSAVIHEEHRLFNYELMVMDQGGGGLGVRDDLREPIQDTGAEKFSVIPLITCDDDLMRGVGQDRLVLFSRGESRLQKLGIMMIGESVLPNKMHELFKAALEASPQRARFPLKWEGWSDRNMFTTPDQMRDWLNEAGSMGTRDRINAELDLAQFQLAVIDREMERDGVTVKQDKYGLYTFTSTCKKDSAYAVIYGFFAVWIWLEERHIKERRRGSQGPRVYAEIQNDC